MKKRLSSILIVLSLLLTLLPAQVFAEEVAVERLRRRGSISGSRSICTGGS